MKGLLLTAALALGNPARSEIQCQFIILARKDEPTPDYARHRITRKDGLTPDYALGRQRQRDGASV